MPSATMADGLQPWVRGGRQVADRNGLVARSPRNKCRRDQPSQRFGVATEKEKHSVPLWLKERRIEGFSLFLVLLLTFNLFPKERGSRKF
jgi:hypothetical protein